MQWGGVMQRDRRETALVTGASEGIGRELARVFASQGFDVVVVARRAALLEALAEELSAGHGVRAVPIALDLAKPDAPRLLFERTEQLGLRVDALVNNAGVMEFGAFAETPLDRLLAMPALNASVLVALTRLFLPPMLEARRGRILNLGSTGSFAPMPSLAVYAATKAFILSFSEALAEELLGTGVSVTCCCPGFTETRMASQIDGVERLKGVAPLMDPAEVARDAYQACMRGDVLRVPGVANQLLIGALSLPPRAVVRWLGGAIGRRVMHAPTLHG
jgi:short-subunit dehydrogenase